MTRELMSLANGKVVLALEGGYDIPSICASAEYSVKALLGDEVSENIYRAFSLIAVIIFFY